MVATFVCGQTPVGPPTISGSPTIQNVTVYPSPVVTATAGSVVPLQFEAQFSNGQVSRNITGLSILSASARGLSAKVNCAPVIGQCTVTSQLTGSVTVGAFTPDGNFGYGSGQVTIIFVPAENQARVGGDALILSTSSVQATDQETLSLFATSPKDYPGTYCQLQYTVNGSMQNLSFPTCFTRGQRVLLGKVDVLPQQAAGNYSFSAAMYDAAGNTLAFSTSSYVVKSVFNMPMTSQFDYASNLTVSAIIYTQNTNLQIVLMRGDGFYLPLPTITFASGMQQQMTFYNGSLGYSAQLPSGCYTVAVLAQFLDGSGSYSQVVPNGVCLNQALFLN